MTYFKLHQSTFNPITHICANVINKRTATVKTLGIFLFLFHYFFTVYLLVPLFISHIFHNISVIATDEIHLAYVQWYPYVVYM